VSDSRTRRRCFSVPPPKVQNICGRSRQVRPLRCQRRRCGALVSARARSCLAPRRTRRDAPRTRRARPRNAISLPVPSCVVRRHTLRRGAQKLRRAVGRRAAGDRGTTAARRDARRRAYGRLWRASIVPHLSAADSWPGSFPNISSSLFLTPVTDLTHMPLAIFNPTDDFLLPL
jgi:hypothetical protein